jgi:hypothetical protein
VAGEDVSPGTEVHRDHQTETHHHNHSRIRSQDDDPAGVPGRIGEHASCVARSLGQAVAHNCGVDVWQVLAQPVSEGGQWVIARCQ